MQLRFLICLVFLGASAVSTTPDAALEETSCGDWDSYKDEKCFKIHDETKNYDEAAKICQANGSTLVSISSAEEQAFLATMLFKTHKVVDAVWLGAKYRADITQFKWADESELKYSNWAAGSPADSAVKACVQMIPEGATLGQWLNEPCTKKNLVVCQKAQTWTLGKLQTVLLASRKDLSDEIELLKANPVPIGFIYTQLPNQPEPRTIWPSVAKWEMISSEFAGHFFRVEGGDAPTFGNSQADALQGHAHQYDHLSCDSGIVYYDYGDHGGFARYCSRETYTSDSTVARGSYGAPRESSETRPINYSIRLWKRTA